MCVQTNVNTANRLITLHVGEISGFLPNVKLIYRAGSATGDYHGQMNATNFAKWIITVLDNEPYQSSD